MTSILRAETLIKNTLSDATRMIVPSLTWAALFIALWGATHWFVIELPDGGVWTLLFLVAAFATLYAHALFSHAMYASVLDHEEGRWRSAWKLSLAWLLVFFAVGFVLAGFAMFYTVVATSLSIVLDLELNTPDDVREQVMRDPVITLFFLTIFPGLIWIFWFVTRLMTFAAATCSRAQIHVFRTWPWTKGHFKVLGPCLLILVFVPIGVATALAVLACQLLPATLDDAAARALRSGLIMAFCTPPAWLGHAVAANVYKALSKEDEAASN